MHHPTDRITHTTAFVTPVVEHWLEREIAQWVHPMKDRSDDPSHHERTLYLWATSCPVFNKWLNIIYINIIFYHITTSGRGKQDKPANFIFCLLLAADASYINGNKEREKKEENEWMNEWLFNNTLARKPDRLLGVRKRERKIDTFNPKFGLVLLPFTSVRMWTLYLLRFFKKKIIIILNKIK